MSPKHHLLLLLPIHLSSCSGKHHLPGSVGEVVKKTRPARSACRPCLFSGEAYDRGNRLEGVFLNEKRSQRRLFRVYAGASADSTYRGINEERSGSDYSEFTSQSAALTRRRLLDEYAGSELQRKLFFQQIPSRNRWTKMLHSQEFTQAASCKGGLSFLTNFKLTISGTDCSRLICNNPTPIIKYINIMDNLIKYFQDNGIDIRNKIVWQTTFDVDAISFNWHNELKKKLASLGYRTCSIHIYGDLNPGYFLDTESLIKKNFKDLIITVGEAHGLGFHKLDEYLKPSLRNSEDHIDMEQSLDNLTENIGAVLVTKHTLFDWFRKVDNRPNYYAHLWIDRVTGKILNRIKW